MGDGSHTGARSGGRRATGGHTTALVSAEEVGWLVAHLRAVVAASPAAWAGPPATSAMVDRLIRTGLVCRAPDPQDRRRVQLTITARAEAMIGRIGPNTARRLQAVLNGMGPQARRYLVDVLRDTVRRSAGQPRERLPRP